MLLSLGIIWGQGRPYEGPDDPAGDIAAIREGFMTGNRVFLYFKNTTQLSDWPRSDVSRWPNNYEGLKMLDGVAVLIGARVFLENDSVPVTDKAEIESRTDLDTLYFCQTNYREGMDTDPTGTINWGFYPVFGYFNENNEYPAMSNIKESWPVDGWPSTGGSKKWPGEWNGRFGRGVIKADLETFFVVNDAQDQEYLGNDDTVKYYPRPGVYIGDKKKDVTIQYGKPWGGLGIRVETRGFQWNNPQARDAIFWEYKISNISDYDIPDMAFGFHVDNAIGGDEDDEIAYFNTYIDLAYSWDISGTGLGGVPTGTMGFAYLESPGLPYDGIDNDDDGLLDEKRDNEPTKIIGPTEGIANLDKFLKYYGLKEEDLKPHWDADEDQDWQDGNDVNNNGIYDIGENPGDDVGLDGVAPGDLNYNGPDADGTECNHRPDFKEGVGCEPNFNLTDISESDQIGLTAFQMYPSESRQGEFRTFRGDKCMWSMMSSNKLEEYYGKPENLIEFFASGVFPLYKGRTERYSMAILHSYDPLEGLNSVEHKAPSLFKKKEIVQVIYEGDYRFASPPLMPTLKAYALDGKVILTWDAVADKLTREPLLRNTNDFEGYKLYRATDKKFSDAEVVTDGYGVPMFKKPIFQCDKIDNIQGFTNFALVNGMGYYLGDESGIVHYFIDTNVKNGKTYYYGLVAYDYGIPDIGEDGIAPSENNLIIELDESENVKKVSKNVQIVTPHVVSAGYVFPEYNVELNDIKIGKGAIIPEILNNNEIKSHQYKIKFTIDTVSYLRTHDNALQYLTSGFYVYDVTDSNKLVYYEDKFNYVLDNLVYYDSIGNNGSGWSINPTKDIYTDVFDGVRLKITCSNTIAEFDTINSGWKVGDAPINIQPTVLQSTYYPWDYEIIFTDDSNVFTGLSNNRRGIRGVDNEFVNGKYLLVQQNFSFYVINKTFLDSTGSYEKLDMIVNDLNRNGQYDMLEDEVLVGVVNKDNKWCGTVFVIDFKNAEDESQLPEANDVYFITFKRPFYLSDSLIFSIKSSSIIDKDRLNSQMENIKVVPNPYVMTNSMEEAVANYKLNQRRKIMFTHIPAKCEIQIFTSSGVFVDKIEVDNPADNGTAFWDLKSDEGLDVAAGIYIYYIKSLETGAKKIGKFAIIK